MTASRALDAALALAPTLAVCGSVEAADLAVVPTDVVDKGRALSPRFGLLHGLTTEEDSRCPMLVRGSTTLAGVC
jgi:hypothetical protein